MKPESILVTAAGGDIGASVIKAVKGAGYRVVGCDMKQAVFAGKMLDGFYKVPSASDACRYLESVAGIIKAENVRFFVPVAERELEMLNANRETLKGWKVEVLMNNRVVLDNFLDKYNTVLFLEKIGLRTPKTVLLNEYDGEWGFPVIIKPRKGCGGKHRWKAEEQNDLDFVRGKYNGTEFVVQEYLDDDENEFTTGVFSDGRKTSSITFRRKLGFGGVSVEAQLCDVFQIEKMAETIAAHTKLDGAINIQSRLVDGEYVPFEINPRLSSTLLFRKKFGFDDAVWWIKTRTGKGYDYIKHYKSGKAVRLLEEFYFDMEPV